MRGVYKNMKEDWDEDIDLQKELQNIEAWEKEQKQVFFWEKLSRLPFMLLDKVTPKLIRDKLGDLLGEMGRFMQTAWAISRSAQKRAQAA